jgi:hypothetical protein
MAQKGVRAAQKQGRPVPPAAVPGFRHSAARLLFPARGVLSYEKGASVLGEPEIDTPPPPALLRSARSILMALGSKNLRRVARQVPLSLANGRSIRKSSLLVGR